jgi:purine-cytosine permease-like protein
VSRRYVTAAVVVALVYFYIRFVNEPLPDLGHGSWSHFWVGADAALAVSISWVPMAADYTRHSRSERAAFGAASVAYGLTQIVAYVLGLLALALVAGDPAKVFGPFQHVTLGTLFFAVFVLREADQSFANVYSTAMSIQNLMPRLDRRLLTVVLGALTTVFALALNMNNYAGFLTLIGSVFVPMLGVLAVDFFVFTGRRGWDVSGRAPARPAMIVAWAAGIATYQLINPGTAGWWSRLWTNAQSELGFTPAAWMSASLLSFLVAGAVTAVIGGFTRRSRPGRPYFT